MVQQVTSGPMIELMEETFGSFAVTSNNYAVASSFVEGGSGS